VGSIRRKNKMKLLYKDFLIKRLYKRMKPEEFGTITNALVVFSKTGYIMQTKVLEGGKCETIVAQYRYYLRIDAFFFVIWLDWLGKDRSLPIEELNTLGQNG
jgi:hypothetical protein